MLCQVLKVNVGSAAEAELGGLYHNCQEAEPLRTCLEELGHPQPPTPVQTDNSTAAGLVHDVLKQKRSKAMDMRFFWVRDRSKQGHFNIYWRRGKGNKSDYFTKAHPVAHHRNLRPYYLFDKNNPEPYYDPKVNYYAPLQDDDDDTVATEPETDFESGSETDSDGSDGENDVVSNCVRCIRPESAGEGVFLSPSGSARATALPSTGLSS